MEHYGLDGGNGSCNRAMNVNRHHLWKAQQGPVEQAWQPQTLSFELRVCEHGVLSVSQETPARTRSPTSNDLHVALACIYVYKLATCPIRLFDDGSL